MSKRESIRNVLKIILKGYTIQERSWNGEGYTKTSQEAMIEAADGDEEAGYTAYLMSYNANDLQMAAMELEVGYDINGNPIDLPSPNYPDDCWAEWNVQRQDWDFHPKNNHKDEKVEVE